MAQNEKKTDIVTCINITSTADDEAGGLWMSLRPSWLIQRACLSNWEEEMEGRKERHKQRDRGMKGSEKKREKETER